MCCLANRNWHLNDLILLGMAWKIKPKSFHHRGALFYISQKHLKQLSEELKRKTNILVMCSETYLSMEVCSKRKFIWAKAQHLAKNQISVRSVYLFLKHITYCIYFSKYNLLYLKERFKDQNFNSRIHYHWEFLVLSVSQEIRKCLIDVCIKLGCPNAFYILTVVRTVNQPSTTPDVPRPST